MAKEVKKITPSKPKATVAKAKGEDPVKASKTKAPAPAPKKVEAPEKDAKKADGKDGNKKIYHVSKRDNDGREWKVFIQGSDKVIRVVKTQAEALKIAQEFAKNDGNATVILHGLDGKIRKA